MLSWFVEAGVANNAFHNGILIKENEVEVQPEKVPMKCLDEDVSINLIRKYFTFDGWKQVEMIMGVLQEKGCWICPTCMRSIIGESIVCESCLDWFHLPCVGLTKAPKKQWFCRSCYN